MTRRMSFFILCAGVVLLGVACATKDFVRERVNVSATKLGDQVTAVEKQLTDRANRQEADLRDTAARTGENRRAVDAADQRLGGLDTRVNEVGAVAEGAKTRADSAAMSTQDAEARLNQRFAGRNRYRLLDTKSIHFDSDKIELRSQDVSQLDELARALAADPNAILELQGFADPQGGDRYNRDLARERVEAAMRYLMQRHGIELRQLRGITMGKVALAPGEQPTADVLAAARRVDARLFAPWSSWEDSQAQGEQAKSEGAATPESATPAPATAVRPSDEQPSALPREVVEERPAEPPYRRLLELIETVTPQDLRRE